ncbi:MAG: hypothetical protein OXG40_07160 [Acidimicrobiaceae bacterium]|nr:hypothetical protein [Acidimicrobiaceae bacterium]MDE0517743.1 hypothetical protein [Acidimicrobiaceae bacterium]
MEEISTLVSPLVLPLTVSVVPVLYVVNVAKDRPRPLREAVDTAPTHVARWVLWLALALTVVYSVLYTLDRWGAWALAALFFSPLVGVTLALPVVKTWKKLRRGAALPEPLTPGPPADEDGGL